MEKEQSEIPQLERKSKWARIISEFFRHFIIASFVFIWFYVVPIPGLLVFDAGGFRISIQLLTLLSEIGGAIAFVISAGLISKNLAALKRRFVSSLFTQLFRTYNRTKVPQEAATGEDVKDMEKVKMPEEATEVKKTKEEAKAEKAKRAEDVRVKKTIAKLRGLFADVSIYISQNNLAYAERTLKQAKDLMGIGRKEYLKMKVVALLSVPRSILMQLMRVISLIVISMLNWLKRVLTKVISAYDSRVKKETKDESESSAKKMNPRIASPARSKKTIHPLPRSGTAKRTKSRAASSFTGWNLPGCSCS